MVVRGVAARAENSPRSAVSALLRAEKRGVEVRPVADQNSNESENRPGKARADLNFAEASSF